eukprot:TRINITY_DN35193_c0_g1_i1.p1 TRINITY_DN35193_c0_g1~~TRINITY_DN35193_c0_g1_i1.p1  ORF type:complete len:262 (+),score=28.62 TRINITY_DN35193_c0_g1_i1:544-1329(+)
MRAYISFVGSHLQESGALLLSCKCPLHLWLVACFAVDLSWMALFLVCSQAEESKTWWFLRPRSRLGRAGFTCAWAVLWPLKVICAAMGGRWLLDTFDNSPGCLIGMLPNALVVFEVFCCAGVFAFGILLAFVVEARRSLAADRLQVDAVVDDDLLQRWGAQKPSAERKFCGGVDAASFKFLPPAYNMPEGEAGCQCVICMQPLDVDDTVRALPQCGHRFHRPCIDLWLLRSCRCPLCNTQLDVENCVGSAAGPVPSAAAIV